MKKIRYALIGCGRIAPSHITAIKNNRDDIELVGVCDLEREKAEALLSANGFENIPVFDNHRELLETVRPDMCAVATSSGDHAAVAADCLKSGANTLVEKPIALSLADADMLISVANEKKLTLGVCFQNRFNKAVCSIRSAIDEGRFGRLFYGTANIRWGRDKNYYDQASWRGTWEQDGGALMNQCIHDIDLLVWMMGGKPKEVFAYTDRLNHDYIEAEDLGLAVIKFENGSYGIIEGTTDVYPKNLEETLCIFGEKGTVRAGGKAVNTIEDWIFGDRKEDVEKLKADCLESSSSVYGFGHTPLYRNFIDAVKTGAPLKATAYDGRRALEVILAVYRSAADGKPVSFPLENGATVDYKGRFK